MAQDIDMVDLTATTADDSDSSSALPKTTSSPNSRLGKIEHCDKEGCDNTFVLSVHSKKGEWGDWLCEQCGPHDKAQQKLNSSDETAGETEICDECSNEFQHSVYSKRGQYGGYLCRDCGPHDKPQRQRTRPSRSSGSVTANLTPVTSPSTHGSEELRDLDIGDEATSPGNDDFYEKLYQTQTSRVFRAPGKPSTGSDSSSGRATSTRSSQSDSLFCTPSPPERSQNPVRQRRGFHGAGPQRKAPSFKPVKLSGQRGYVAPPVSPPYIQTERPRKRPAAVPEHIGGASFDYDPPEPIRYNSRRHDDRANSAILSAEALSIFQEIPPVLNAMRGLIESMTELKKDNNALHAELKSLRKENRDLSKHVDDSMYEMAGQIQKSIKQLNDKYVEAIEASDDAVGAGGSAIMPLPAGGAYGGPIFAATPRNKFGSFGLSQKGIEAKREKLKQQRSGEAVYRNPNNIGGREDRGHVYID